MPPPPPTITGELARAPSRTSFPRVDRISKKIRERAISPLEFGPLADCYRRARAAAELGIFLSFSFHLSLKLLIQLRLAQFSSPVKHKSIKIDMREREIHLSCGPIAAKQFVIQFLCPQRDQLLSRAGATKPK
jgi:hypothetical protein